MGRVIAYAQQQRIPFPLDDTHSNGHCPHNTPSLAKIINARILFNEME